jgi:hypothetical protein
MTFTISKKFGRRDRESQAAELMIFGSAIIARIAGLFKPAAAIKSNKNGSSNETPIPVVG